MRANRSDLFNYVNQSMYGTVAFQNICGFISLLQFFLTKKEEEHITLILIIEQVWRFTPEDPENH